MEVYDKLMKCYESFKSKINFRPEIAMILGSGLGDFAESIEVVETLPYNEIDGFPVSTVEGHKGRFIFGYIDKVPVVIMQGRVHYYEGYPITDVVLPTRLMALMGAKVLFLTNAAGGVNYDFRPGDFMLIEDHISSFVPSPMVGRNMDEFGVRFPDMTDAYDKDLRIIIEATAMKENIKIKKGVYLQVTGPEFETPAEIKAYRNMGADATGMSTAVEAIAARHMGVKVCGISCISNMAAGMTGDRLTAEEVFETANAVAPDFKKLLTESVKAIAKEI